MGNLRTEKRSKEEIQEEIFTYLIRGERPPYMSQEDFKLLRKESQHALRKHLRGRFLHISTDLREKRDGDGEVSVVDVGKGQYVTEETLKKLIKEDNERI